MAQITAQLVKDLRERTGAGMMECKKALLATNGDIGEAEVYLRKQGLASDGQERSTRRGQHARALPSRCQLSNRARAMVALVVVVEAALGLLGLW